MGRSATTIDDRPWDPPNRDRKAERQRCLDWDGKIADAPRRDSEFASESGWCHSACTGTTAASRALRLALERSFQAALDSETHRRRRRRRGGGSSRAG